MGRACSRPSLAFADGWGRGWEPSQAGDYLRRQPSHGASCAVGQGGASAWAAPRRWPGAVSRRPRSDVQVGTPAPMADGVTPAEVRLHLGSHPCSGL